jgi:hypothetical protein
MTFLKFCWIMRYIIAIENKHHSQMHKGRASHYGIAENGTGIR